MPYFCNCLIWALARLRRKGGYIVFRRGRHGFWFHAMWTSGPGHPVFGYVPPRGWHFRSYWMESVLAFGYHGHVDVEEPDPRRPLARPPHWHDLDRLLHQSRSEARHRVVITHVIDLALGLVGIGSLIAVAL